MTTRRNNINHVASQRLKNDISPLDSKTVRTSNKHYEQQVVVKKQLVMPERRFSKIRETSTSPFREALSTDRSGGPDPQQYDTQTTIKVPNRTDRAADMDVSNYMARRTSSLFQVA